MRRYSKQHIEVVITDRGENHKLVKIYRNGRVYAATYAEPFPSRETALADYKNNPKSFEPYNEMTGAYCGKAGNS